MMFRMTVASKRKLSRLATIVTAERNEYVAELATALSVNAERIFGSFA